jgi:hypothetical protein
MIGGNGVARRIAGNHSISKAGEAAGERHQSGSLCAHPTGCDNTVEKSRFVTNFDSLDPESDRDRSGPAVHSHPQAEPGAYFLKAIDDKALNIEHRAVCTPRCVLAGGATLRQKTAASTFWLTNIARMI